MNINKLPDLPRYVYHISARDLKKLEKLDPVRAEAEYTARDAARKEFESDPEYIKIKAMHDAEYARQEEVKTEVSDYIRRHDAGLLTYEEMVNLILGLRW